MYDDGDDYSGGSGLGNAALFWVGYNWGASTATRAKQLLNNITPRLTYSRHKSLVYTDEYYALVANRDEWREHARKLEEQVEELQVRIRQYGDEVACGASLYFVETQLRELAEQGYADTEEYLELAELQRTTQDEFKQGRIFDADAHAHRAIDLASDLRSRLRK